LEDRRISSKSLAEQLGISRERVGSIIHEDLDMLVACFLPDRAKDLSAAPVRTDYIRQTLETVLFIVESCVCCYTAQHSTFFWELVSPDTFTRMFNVILVCMLLSNFR
jgi:hypothetical protein